MGHKLSNSSGWESSYRQIHWVGIRPNLRFGSIKEALWIQARQTGLTKGALVAGDAGRSMSLANVARAPLTGWRLSRHLNRLNIR